MAPTSWRKVFLGPKADVRPVWFSEGFMYISKRGESTYKDKFSKVNKAEGDGRSLFYYFKRENSASYFYLFLYFSYSRLQALTPGELLRGEAVLLGFSMC